MNTSRYLPYRYWLGMAAFWLMATLLRWWAVPTFERLPADFVAETICAAKMRSHQTTSSPAKEFECVVRRRDQTLTSGDKYSIIQGDVHWLKPAGVVVFETFNLYGVDRHNRQNLAGYGSEERTGQYLFPQHTERKQYGLWDPVYAGPRVATFDHVDQFRGVEVYVFNTLADGIDETAGYASLPEVPEKYYALSYGKGRLWIEPVSGIVVDHEDSGVSYFVDPKTGERIGEPIVQWSQRYTPETIDAQLQLATATRRRMRALEVWLPLAFAAAGLICLVAGFRAPRGGAR